MKKNFMNVVRRCWNLFSFDNRYIDVTKINALRKKGMTPLFYIPISTKREGVYTPSPIQIKFKGGFNEFCERNKKTYKGKSFNNFAKELFYEKK